MHLGAIAVAPLIIGLARLLDDRPQMGESVEGMVALVVLTAVSIGTLATSSDYWFSIAPLGLILPLLFWLAARGRPLFAAAGVFILALVIVWTTTFGVGRLGRPEPTSARSCARCSRSIAACFAVRLDPGRAVCREAAQRGGAPGQQRATAIGRRRCRAGHLEPRSDLRPLRK